MQLNLLDQILPGVATASVTMALAVAITTTNQPTYAGNNKLVASVQPMLTAQAVNKTVYVILFNPHTDDEGIYTILFNDRNNVLMFELAKDANDFVKKVIEEKPNNVNIPTPVVKAINAQEVITFCQTKGYDYELIPAGKKITPPSTWFDELSDPSMNK